MNDPAHGPSDTRTIVSFDTKVAILILADLATWQKLNVTAFLATGIAGLLAGALSMGAGEYVSVHSQRELLDASTPSATSSAFARCARPARRVHMADPVPRPLGSAGMTTTLLLVR